jgi:hypothetical protein
MKNTIKKQPNSSQSSKFAVESPIVVTMLTAWKAARRSEVISERPPCSVQNCQPWAPKKIAPTRATVPAARRPRKNLNPSSSKRPMSPRVSER